MRVTAAFAVFLLVIVSVSAQDNPDCAVILPANLLTAAGLATPFILVPQPGTTGNCSQANTDQQAFAQATILNKQTGAIYSYTPLIITRGTVPAITPVVLNNNIINQHTVISIFFGSNGNTLQLLPADYLENGNTVLPAAFNCVNGGGADNSVFGQVAFCNHVAFYEAATCLINRGLITVPAPGVGADGLPCLTTRSFAHVDQDPSDNVVSQYWLTADGRTAPYYPLTATQMLALTVNGHAPKLIQNGSDNRLLDVIVAHNFNCHHYWATPDVTNGVVNPLLNISSQPLNEIQAALYQIQPAALIPANDEMVMTNGQTTFDLKKLNAYRLGVNQPLLPPSSNPLKTDASPYRFCINLIMIQTARLLFDKQLLHTNNAATAISPTAGQSYFAFMAQRLDASIGVLQCNNLFGLTNTVFANQGPLILLDSTAHPILDANGLFAGTVLNDGVTAADAIINVDYLAAVFMSVLEINPVNLYGVNLSQLQIDPAINTQAQFAGCDGPCLITRFTNIAAILGTPTPSINCSTV